jgi:hypothetical protein
MNLFAGQRGAKAWKRAMTEIHGAGREGFARALWAAVDLLDDDLLDRRPE